MSSSAAPALIGLAPTGLGLAPAGLGLAPTGLGLAPTGLGLAPTGRRLLGELDPEESGDARSTDPCTNHLVPLIEVLNLISILPGLSGPPVLHYLSWQLHSGEAGPRRTSAYVCISVYCAEARCAFFLCSSSTP